MKRRFRLKSSKDINFIRQAGKSFSNPLVVLISLPNQSSRIGIGIIATKRVGGAVQRNRCKRLLRSAILPHIDLIKPGSDILFIARQQLLTAKYEEIRSSIEVLLFKAQVLKDKVDG